MAGNRPTAGRAPRASAGAFWRDALALGLAAIVAIVALVESAGLNPEAAVFPRTVGIAMLAFTAFAAIRLVVFGQAREPEPGGSTLRRVVVPVLMLGAVGLIPLVGFGVAGVVMGVGLFATAQHERLGWGPTLLIVASVVAVVFAFTFGFRDLLGVPLPRPSIF